MRFIGSPSLVVVLVDLELDVRGRGGVGYVDAVGADEDRPLAEGDLHRDPEGPDGGLGTGVAVDHALGRIAEGAADLARVGLRTRGVEPWSLGERLQIEAARQVGVVLALGDDRRQAAGSRLTVDRQRELAAGVVGARVARRVDGREAGERRGGEEHCYQGAGAEARSHFWSFLVSSLAEVSRRRGLAVGVVAPAGDVSVRPEPTGVGGTGAQRAEGAGGG